MDLAGRKSDVIKSITSESEKKAQRFIIRLTSKDGTIQKASGGFTTAETAGYLADNLIDTRSFLKALIHLVEGLGEAFIESIRTDPFEISVIAENRETARTVREFHREEVLAKLFRVALRKHWKSSEGFQAKVEGVVLVEPPDGKVDSAELVKLREKAERELSELLKKGIILEKSLSEGSVVKTKTKTETLEKRVKQSTTKKEISDVESIFAILNAAKPEDRLKAENTTEKQISADPLFAFVSLIQQYKQHMEACQFDKVTIVKGKALELIQTEFESTSVEELDSLGERVRQKGEYCGAILLHELAGTLFAGQNSLDAAVGTIDSMLGVNESLKALAKSGSAAVKLIARDYALAAMLRLEEAVRSMDNIEAKERTEREAWCLYRISECHELTGDFKSSLRALREARQLVDKARGKEGAPERRVYGAILNAIGYAHHQMATQSKARKYYKLALEVAAKNAADFESCEKRSRHVKIYETNLSIVEK